MLLAIATGLPLGILLTRRRALSKPVIGAANIVQTIPSLALFGFLLPAPWLGERADRLAIAALTLYALLPVIRNTYTGILGVDPGVREAARGMGKTDRQLLLQVELPLAGRYPGGRARRHRYHRRGRHHRAAIGAGAWGNSSFAASPWWITG